MKKFYLLFILSFLAANYSFAQVSGNVYVDVNGDGTKNTTGAPFESGRSGIVVNAYNNFGNVVGTATTDAAGNYTISGVSGTLRVEFNTNEPLGKRVGADNSNVQFVTAPATNVNLALMWRDGYCITDCNTQKIAITMGLAGNPLVAGSQVANAQALYILDAQMPAGNAPNNGGTTAVGPQGANYNYGLIGTTYGLTYQKETRTVLASAYLKRHAGFGPGGIDAIYAYQVDASGQITGAPTVITNLNSIGLNVGTNPRANSGVADLPSTSAGLSLDPDVFPLVGKIGIGQITLNEKGNILYVVNLLENKVHAINIGNPIKASITAADVIGSYPIAAPTALGANVEWHPMSIKYYRGKLYIGGITSKQRTDAPQNNQADKDADQVDLKGYVVSLNEDGTNQTTALSWPFTYRRGYCNTDLRYAWKGNFWRAWQNNGDEANLRNDINIAAGAVSPPNTNFNTGIYYPQPMVSDIEFDVDGEMIIGIRDRFGDQVGFNQPLPGVNGSTPTSATPGQLFRGLTSGEILRAGQTGANTWVLENDASLTHNGATQASAGQATNVPALSGTYSPATGTPYGGPNAMGPGATNNGSGGYNAGGYYYFNHAFDAANVPTTDVPGNSTGVVTAHYMKGNGGLALVPGCDKTIFTAMDPDGQTFGSGLISVSNKGLIAGSTPGNMVDQIQLVISPGSPIIEQINGGKANAIGDVEVLGDVCPIEIGNRVWFDADDDGVQDANENPIANLPITLRSPGIDGIYGNGDDQIWSTTTDANGNYYFGLATGDGAVNDNRKPASWVGLTSSNSGILKGYDYRLEINPTNALLTGFEATAANINSNNQDNRDNDGVLGSPQGATTPIVYTNVNTSATNYNYDFGFKTETPTGSIGNYVWKDIDQDGIANDGAANGFNGVKVILLDASQNPIDSTFTANDANGNPGYYSLNKLPSASYYVKFPTVVAGFDLTAQTPTAQTDLNSDASLSTGISPIVVINALGTGQNKDNTTIDAGYITEPSASIGNQVWLDNNQNGIRDANDKGVAGVVVTLYQNGPDGLAGTIDDVVIGSTNTDAYGYYKFNNLTPSAGDATKFYNVVFSPQPNYGFTQQVGAGDNGDNTNSDANPVQGSLLTGVTGGYDLIADEDDTTVDAGIILLPALSSTVGDYVWLDANKDGVQDANETGISNVTVILRDNNNNIIMNTQTDAEGKYLFINVPPGNGYYVEFVPPVGMIPSPSNGALLDTANSDMNTLTFKTSTFNLALDDTILHVDAGFYPQDINKASIGDRVWYDADNDGIQDAGETGVSGVTVNLLNQAGTVIATTTTDPLGNYVFNNLDSGAYQVEIVAPSGYTITSINQGSNDLLDGDFDPITAKSPLVTLNPGDRNMSVDAGLYNAANTNSIGDRVWLDKDIDGIQDADEIGVGGITVSLIDDATGNVLNTTMTDENGNYLFNALPNGSYKVRFTNLPFGYAISPQNTDAAGILGANNSDPIPGNGLTAPVTLSGNTNVREVDAGIYNSGSDGFTANLGNRVWYDLDNDGVQDINEIGVEGILVTLLDLGVDGIAGTADDGPNRQQITDDEGSYLFTGLSSGNYQVQFDLASQPGWNPSTANVGDDRLDSDGSPLVGSISTSPIYTLKTGEANLTVDLGIYKPLVNSIGNYVWIDANKNGIQDAGESPVAGVQVKLYNPNGTVYDSDPLKTGIQPLVTSTNKDGYYAFVELPDGSYRVGFDQLPEGYQLTIADQGNSDELDSDADPVGLTPAVTVIGGQNNSTLDAGIFSDTRAALGDYVWVDYNYDGIQDANEPVLEGVKVSLFDANGDVVASAITDEKGIYFFPNLLPGTYTLGFESLPDGTTFTAQNAGANDSLDSDVNPATGRTAPIVLNAGDVNRTIDVGIIPIQVGSLGDYVWEDINKDGIQDVNESGVAGVLVTLLNNTTGKVVGTAVTDGNGYYRFDNLPSSDTYSATFSNIPKDYTFTQNNGAVADSLNSDANVSTGATGIANVPPFGINPTVDAGIFKVFASIGNYVWVDANGDGMQDPTEAGLNGTTVYLYNASDVLIDSQTTVTGPDGKEGYYRFNTQSLGNFKLGFKYPAGGYTPTQSLMAGDNYNDNNSDASTTPDANGVYKTGFFNLVSGEYDSTVDAGVKPPLKASIGNLAWLDNDKDGFRDPEDEGLAGVIMTLYTNGPDGIAGSVDDILVGSTITDAYGFYKFIDLEPSNGDPTKFYNIAFTPQTNYGYTLLNNGGDNYNDFNSDVSPVDTNVLFGVTDGYDLAPGEFDSTADAGYILLPSISATVGDYVWLDVNKDGKQDANEKGISNVTVMLKDANTGAVVMTTQSDADGKYLFLNVPINNNYIVEFVPRVGYIPSPATGILTDNDNSDMNPLTYQSTSFFIGEDDTLLSVDAGFYPQDSNKASIGDRVWYDLNNDGIQDAGELGIPNVTVNLLDQNGNIIATYITNVTGRYLFNNLDSGTYQIEVVPPSGFAITSADQGTNDAIDGDFDPNTNRSQLVTLNPGDRNMTVDVGLFNATNNNSIGDRVWLDINRDGIQDVGEIGVGGVTVSLIDDATGNVLSTVMTDDNGNYLFAGLPDGTYRIKFSNLDFGYAISPLNTDINGVLGANNSDAIPGSGLTAPVTLAGGANVREVDMGIYSSGSDGLTATLGNRVWYDLNNNGIQDNDEIGVEGIFVTLLDVGPDGIPNTADDGVSKEQYTDDKGIYKFTGLPGSNYQVFFDLSSVPGWDVSPDGAGDPSKDSDGSPVNGGISTSPVVALKTGETNLTIDLGIYKPNVNAIGNYVWIDSDKDGIQDANESPMPGVEAILLNANGSVYDKNPNIPGIQPYLASTNFDGYYSFIDLPDGSYRVDFVQLPEGYVLTNADQGGNDELDSDADSTTGVTSVVTVMGGQINKSLDAGLYSDTRAALGDYVWVDYNNNGLQDANEPSLQGVKVTLYDANNNKVASIITGQDGGYFFPNLLPGSYSVGFDNLPDGTRFTAADQGANDSLDSDVNPATGRTPLYVLNAGDVNRTVDVGIIPIPLGSLGNFVWYDDNENGLQDSGEQGVPGVLVTLVNSATGDIVGHAITNGSGNYRFDNLSTDDTYYAVFSNLPLDYVFTNASGIVSDLFNSDADSITGTTGSASVPAFDINPTLDAGIIIKKASLGDYVWYDYNKNGIQDSIINPLTMATISAEKPVVGAKMYLYNATTNALLDSTLTDSTGYYQFKNLKPGAYNVGIDTSSLPNDLVYGLTKNNEGANDSLDNDIDPATNKTALVVLKGGDNNPTLDAGIVRSPSAALADPCTCFDVPFFEGEVRQVLDAIDVKSGPDEIWYVYEQTGMEIIDTFVYGAIATPALLNENTSGVYTIKFAHNVGAGYSAKLTNGVDTLSIGNICNLPDLVMNTHPATLCVTENPFTVSAQVLLAGNNAQAGTLSYFEVANFNTAIVPIPTANLTQITAVDPSNYNPGDTIVVLARYTPTDPLECPIEKIVKFGVLPACNDTAAIGNRVWLDTDKDGTQDAGEPGVAGVTVTLYNVSGDAIASTVTDGTGAYKFTGLAAGDYSISFTPPADYTFTSSITPGDNQNDNNSDAITTAGASYGRTGLYTLLAGEYDSTVDAGIVSSITQNVGNKVWWDTNKDGLQDSNEEGVAGVTVSLFNDMGTLVATTVTNSIGEYLFKDVPAGDYSMQFTAPIGTVFTQQELSSNTDNTGSNPNQFGTTPIFSVAAGQDNLTIDAGIYLQDSAKASVGNKVWEDLDQDGIQDAGEPGIGNVPVTLKDKDGMVVATTVTNEFGEYIFNNLNAGVYSIEFGTPTGYTASPYISDINNPANSDNNAGTTVPFTLSAGEKNLNVDAGFYQSAPAGILKLGDKVWYDNNKDGIQDSNEPGVAGITVTLLDGSGNILESTATDAQGNYLFTNLAAGNYQVQFANIPQGYSFTQADASGTAGSADLANGGSDDSDPGASGFTPIINLTADNLNVDAGIIAAKKDNTLASLGDRVWYDTDNNGVQDAGEVGVAGITVTLKNAQGGTIGTTTTNALGNYIFTNLEAGDYIVEFSALPVGYVASPTTGTNNATNNDASETAPGSGVFATNLVSLAPGENNPNIDFGIYSPLNAIGDRVWYDNNNNGTQDMDEEGAQGVTVTLFNSLGNAIATTTTDANGNYLFSNLPDGNYSVGFSQLPAGYSLSSSNTPGDNANNTNSDANVNTGKTPVYNLAGGEIDKTVDAGIYNPNVGSIGGQVWDDKNADGTQGTNELVSPGLTVTLKNSSGDIVGVAITDGEGKYLFTNLPFGDYIVEFAKPDGTEWSPAGTGGNPTTDNNAPTGLLGTSISPSAPHTRDNDAAYNKPQLASVGNYVWIDANTDGLQDVTEAPLAGVKVTLFDASGNTVATAITDANGFYQINDLVPGSTYYVKFDPATLPSGSVFTTFDANGNGLIDDNNSDADPLLGTTQPFILLPGEHNPSIDAGVQVPSYIGSYVWNDVNNNGIYDANEKPVKGALVTIYGPDGVTVIASSTTDADGLWKVQVVGDENYFIGIDSNTTSGLHVSDVTDPLGAGDDNDNDVDRITGKSLSPIYVPLGTYVSTGWIGVTGLAPLGIAVQLQGQAQSTGNLLNWVVINNNDVVKYEVEELVNGNFAATATIPTENKATYTYNDYVITDNSTYRIKAIRANGSYVYSNIVTISRSNSILSPIVTPNPTVGNIEVRFYSVEESNAIVHVFDAAGKLVRTINANAVVGYNAVEVDLSQLPQGIYNIQLASDAGIKFSTQIRKN
jgi:hypothetical protein